MASAAAAQDTPVATPAAVQGQEDAATQGGLQEIVVTAQRREESLQRAGIAIDVVTGDELVSQGLSSTSDLGKLVPSLNVQGGGGANTIFFLRGVGNFTVNGYSDPAIAFNYDGVYLGRPTSTSGAFYDLERLEVLKGPQGTLYGRNATAGAINILPAKPRAGEFSGFVNGSYGNFNAVNVQGALNVPMGEDGAFRVSGNVVDRDGYLDDGTSDEKVEALRVQMLARLTPSLTVRVAGDYSHTGGIGTGSNYAGRLAFTPGIGNVFVPSGLGPDEGLFTPASQAYRQTLFAGASGRNLTPLDSDIFQDNKFFGSNAEINWKTGIGTLTVVPAWRSAQLNNKFGVPGFIGNIKENDEQASFEARFNGDRIGFLDYIVGAYYFDETVKGRYVFAQQALNAYQFFTSKTQSLAGFTRLTAHLSDRLRVIGGARYTKDDKDFAGQADVFLVRCTVVVRGRPSCPTAPLLPSTDSFAQLPSVFPIPPIGQVRPIGTTGAILIRATTAVDSKLSNDRLTYRIGAEYDLGPRSLLYASLETGYRSGGFALSAGFETFQPEFIDSYTIGMKNRLFDNRLQLNIEAFYWKYRNQQVNHTGIDANGNQGQFTENVGRSTNKGIEADLQVLATPTTLLNATVQYLDARFDDFVYREPIGAAPPLSGCPFRPSASAGQYDIDCSGQRAYQSPKWTLNLGAQQTIPLGDYKFVGAVDTQYKTSRVVAFQFLPSQIVGDTWVSNAQLSFGPSDDRWSIAGFVRNIEDNRFVTAGQIYNAASATTVIVNAPRTYGMRAGVKF
ncbi:MAG TPA: TonB-dependent receptor [Sphingomonas sp.]|uniref:TonB-dependent receptor n=1 Tax=Sphingomonas sp. TaxID=28214 RepID=UPI002EDB65C9